MSLNDLPERMERLSEAFGEVVGEVVGERLSELETTVEEEFEEVRRKIRWWQRWSIRKKRRLDKRMARGRKRFNRTRKMSLGAGLVAYCLMQNSLNHDGCEKSMLENAAWGLAWPAGYYCGPANGQEYMRHPKDPLDAICAQHDYCIEHSLFPLDDGSTQMLYPKGFVDVETEETRCGLKLGSWKNAEWGARIMLCDQQLVESVVSGFACSDELPMSPFCAEEAYLGKGPCVDTYPFYHPLGGLCRLASLGIKHFEQRKIRRANATITAAAGVPDDDGTVG